MKNQVNIYEEKYKLYLDSLDQIITKLYMRGPEYQSKSFMLCGSDPGVGTTSTAINLSVRLAKSGSKTLLVDLNLCKGAKLKRLNESTDKDLVSYLEFDYSINDIIYSTNIDNLDYIASDEFVIGKQRLLSSLHMKNLVTELKESYDFIIWDTPSLSAIQDPIFCIPYVDDVIVVTAVDIGKNDSLRYVVEEFEKVGKKVLGVIVNIANEKELKSYRYHFNYYNKKNHIGKRKSYEE